MPAAKKPVRKRVEVDPRVWEQVADAPEEVREAFAQFLGYFQQAVDNLPPGATEEEFAAELERLTGGKVDKLDLDSLDENERAELIERDNNPIVKH